MFQKIDNKIHIDLSDLKFSINKFNCVCIIILMPSILFFGVILIKFLCSILWTVLYGIIALHLNIFNLSSEQLIYLSTIYLYHIIFIMYYMNILYNKEYEKFKVFRDKYIRYEFTYNKFNGKNISLVGANVPPLFWLIHNLKLLLVFKLISFIMYLNLFYYGVYKYNEEVEYTEISCISLIFLVIFSLLNFCTRILAIERCAIKKYKNCPDYHYD